MHIPMPSLNANQIMHFWFRVIRSTENDCWKWVGSINKSNNYHTAYLTIGGIKYIAPRLAYYIHTGIDPNEYEIAHTCDISICCNPRHLWLATHQENMQDYFDKGYSPSYGNTRLTKEQIKEIKNLYSISSPESLAKKFGVTRQQIWRIATGRQRTVQ